MGAGMRGDCTANDCSTGELGGDDKEVTAVLAVTTGLAEAADFFS